MKKSTLFLGAHFSISGGLHEALLEAKRYGWPVSQRSLKLRRAGMGRTGTGLI